MSMLELRRVSKVYGQGTAGVHALADVSLPVDEGLMVAVMGPSGSGKSTLLTIAGTLEEPTSGEVLIDGVPADQHPGGKPAAVGAVLLPRSPRRQYSRCTAPRTGA